MIKVGQFMSSRLDVLPPSITKQLEGLQDEVPAVPFVQMRARAEEELGMPLERAFASVDERPLAAASLGQAHRAVLTEDLAAETGLSAVVLKIQRPGIDRIVDVDLRALRKVGVWLSKVALVRDRVDMPSLVEEFAVTSLEEIDYLHEAANSERFATDFGGPDGVAVPEVVWGAHHPPRAHPPRRHGDQDQRRRRPPRGRHRSVRGRRPLRAGDVRPAVRRRLLPRRPAPRKRLRHAARRHDRRRHPGVALHVHRLRHDGRGPAELAPGAAPRAHRGGLA